MCTVSYLPLDNHNYILTSNRDESPFRKSAIFPKKRQVGDSELLFPQDQEAGGSWILTTNNKTSLCLMNGAFEPYNINQKAPNSRGQILFDFFSYSSVDVFLNNYKCNNFLPFTLLIILAKPQLEIIEFRWDGEHKYVEWMETGQARIWSSTMLYPPAVIAKREGWFGEWLRGNKQYSIDEIRRFHIFGGEGDSRTNMKMYVKDRIQTVSITTIATNNLETTFYYEDLKTARLQEASIIVG